jgi:hypothetical protein
MAASTGWVSANKACESLGLDKKTLFKMRDDGTLRLGPHYAAFKDTFSRDSYRWNLNSVRKELRKKGIAFADPLSSVGTTLSSTDMQAVNQ